MQSNQGLTKWAPLSIFVIYKKTGQSTLEKTMTLEEKQQFLIENGIATEEEIRLVTCINGWNDESLDDIYYAREGEHFDD